MRLETNTPHNFKRGDRVELNISEIKQYPLSISTGKGEHNFKHGKIIDFSLFGGKCLVEWESLHQIWYLSSELKGGENE